MRLWNVRFFLLLTCCGVLSSTPSYAVDLPLEAPLPSGAVAMAESGRYQVSRSFEEVLEYYRRFFNRTGGVRWRNVVNLPSIRARHVDSLNKKTYWEGLNIYDKHGQVRIYVLQRATEMPAGSTKAPVQAP